LKEVRLSSVEFEHDLILQTSLEKGEHYAKIMYNGEQITFNKVGCPHMSKWFFINFIVLFFATGKILLDDTPIRFQVPMLFGFLGLLFLFFNWTRHAVFSTIREAPKRETKIKFANMSKKVLPIHRWTGTAALLFIMIHFILITNRYGGLPIQNIKMGSGLLAGLTLLLMVTSGWIRLIHPTVNMRKIHLTLGFTLFFAVVFHLIV